MTVSARIFTITQTERREIDRPSSQAQYGTQTLVTLPAWFTDASYGYAERELNRLSNPLIYATVPMPRAQRGRRPRNQLQSLNVGDLVTLSVEERGTVLARTMFIAGIRRWLDEPHGMPMTQLGLVELWNEASAASYRWILGISRFGQTDSTGTWMRKGTA